MLNLFQYLEDTKGKKVPFEYKVLHNIPLTEDELTVNGNLDFFDAYITCLPDNLTVNGFLDLNYNPHFSCLPNNLYVKGDLYIINTNISELPNNLIVDGYLHCRNTPLEQNIQNDLSLFIKYQKQVKGGVIHA